MSIARKYTTVGAATLASRLTGFVRDVLIAAVLGSSAVADAYIAAFLLPNLFRRVLSEGAFNAAFIPIYARREAANGRESVRSFFNSALSSLIVVVAIAVAAAEFAMPWIIGALTPGFTAQADKFAEAVTFGRIAFGFVGAVVVVALMSSTLNALGRYALAALAPLVLNFMLIGTLLTLLALGWHATRAAGLTLVLTVLVAGLAQLAIVAFGLHAAGMSVRLRRPVIDRDLRLLMARMLPGLMLAGAGHLNMVVAAQMTSGLPSAVSWLYYADRIFQLPLGFVAAAIGVVLLPEVSRALSANDHDGAVAATSRSLEFGLLLVLPAALAIAVLADPIVDVIYRHGAFSEADAAATADVLRALAAALPFFVLVKAFLPPYLARERIRLPLVAALAGIVANIVVTLTLIGRLGAVAAPIGVTVSAMVNTTALGLGLIATGGLPVDAAAWRALPKIALVSCVTALVAYALAKVMSGALAPTSSFGLRAGALAFICVAGVLAHAGLARAVGLADWSGVGKTPQSSEKR